MGQKEWTVNQHYIPQVYLKGFSKDQKRIYRFDLHTQKATNNPIPIRSVAFKKNLYEFTDKEGNFVLRNYLETVLSGFEGLFSDNRDHLISKVSEMHDHVSRNKITGDDKEFWSVYVVLQMMRNPYVLNIAKSYAAEFFKDINLPFSAEGMGITICLPFFSELTAQSKNMFLRYLNHILPLEVFVVVDSEERLFTSDNPIVAIAADLEQQGIDFVIFPITPGIAIVWSDPKRIPKYIANSLVTIGDQDVISIKENIVLFADKSIFSKYPFTDVEKVMFLQIYNSGQRRNFKQHLINN